MSITGCATSLIGATTSSPSSTSPVQQMIVPTIGAKCISFGTNGSGGALIERHPAAEVVRGLRHVLAQEAKHLGTALRQRHQHAAVDHRADLVQPERERGHDPEVAAASTEPPEQVGVLVRVGDHDAAVGGHDLGLDQVVSCQAAAPLDPAAAAAQRQSGDAGGREPTAGHGETVLLRRLIELAPCDASLCPDDPRLRIDLDRLHRREVDDESVVAGAVADRRVPTTADGDRQAVLAAEVDGVLHVLDARAAGDQRRTSVEVAVPDVPRLLVAIVAVLEQLPVERSPEIRHC